MIIKKSLKQYRCKRCEKIFKTTRRYSRGSNKRICEDCIKPKHIIENDRN